MPADVPPATKRAPKARTQAERRARSEKSIVEATVRLIGRRGIQRTTLGDIGTEAGYSRGLPAHLFGNKEALLVHTVKELMKVGFFDVNYAAGLQGLIASIRDWISVVIREPDKARAMHVLMGETLVEKMREDWPELFRTMREFDDASRDHLRGYLESAGKMGEIDSEIDADHEATILLSAIRGLIDQWFVFPNKIDLEHMGVFLVERLYRW